jgi:D-arabinose 1-dehydrogenase-like Zn-dependent alcohol dehydrogenase
VFGVHEDGGMREYIVVPEKQLHAVSPVTRLETPDMRTGLCDFPCDFMSDYSRQGR